MPKLSRYYDWALLSRQMHALVIVKAYRNQEYGSPVTLYEYKQAFKCIAMIICIKLTTTMVFPCKDYDKMKW